MAVSIILPNTGTPGTVGPTVNFPSTDNIRVVSVIPNQQNGFSGVVVIETSSVTNPTPSDFQTLATLTFSNHVDNVTIEFETNHPVIRARIPNTATTFGTIQVTANSRNGQVSGSQGATPATLMVDTMVNAAGSGANFFISRVTVPQLTSDDVYYARDWTKTVTDVLDSKQDKIGNGIITANEADVNTLTGTASYGLTTTDLQKLADVNATASEINYLQGATSNIQTQLNSLAASIPSGLSGITVPAADLNAFFDQSPPTVKVSDIDQLAGLTATAADLNVMTGTAGQVATSDIVKLGQITASATELNILAGATVTTAELNVLTGAGIATADLSAIAGLGGTGVTTTELQYLAGLSTNVQAALSAIPNLTGLVATPADLNLLAGAASGTGAFTNPITSNEIAALNGVTGNIQNQLNNKRDISVPIGISEISGASITTTELNYLQGATSNIQAQINAITTGGLFLPSTGGTLTGPVFIDDGTPAAPGLAYASANNTGLYLYGATGFGVSVAGVRYLTLDGTYMVLGDGITDGAPHMRAPGNSVTDPAYAFVNDTDSGIQRMGPNSVAIVTGAEAMVTADQTAGVVSIGGNTASNHIVDVTGVFNGEKMLGKASIRAGSVTGSIGQTALYTVPVGRSAIITKIYVVLTNVVNFFDPTLFRMNIGWGAMFDEIVDNTNNPTIFNPSTYTFSTPSQVMPLGIGNNVFPAISGSNGADYQALPSGAILQADVTALAGADDFDFDVIVFGHEYI